MKIAQASISELGKIDGRAGNQNGRELNIAKMHTKWNTIIRFKDDEIASNLSKIMIAAVNNMHIGYSQYKRNTIWKYAKKHLSMSRISEDCCCDCSSLVSVAVNLAWYSIYRAWLPNYNIDANACTTSNITSKLLNTGQFDVFPFQKDNVQIGDIVLKEGKHVAVVVE